MTASAKSTQVKVLAILVAVIAACAVAFMFAQPAQAATAKVTTQVKAYKASSFKKAKQGKTAGSTKGTAKTISVIKIKKSGSVKGSVTYKLYAKGKTYSKKNGKAAGSKSKKGQALSVKLTGKLKKKYNVWYRANVKGWGWTSWAKNGSKVGSDMTDMTAVQVKLVKKSASQPKAKGDKFLKKSKTVDKWLKAIGEKYKGDPQMVVNWLQGAVAYDETDRGTIAKTSAFTNERIYAEALAAYKDKRGDCYTFTSVATLACKFAGSTVKATAGKYTSTASGKVQDYSWMTQTYNGKSYIWDVTNPQGTERIFIGSDNALYKQFAAK